MEKNKTIYMYIKDGILDMDCIIDDFSGYLYKIIQNAGNFSKEDTEEMISDTFLILWNNKDKLDLNKNISPYLIGILKNLIKQRYKVFYRLEENIEDYESKLILKEKFELNIEENEFNEKIKEILLKFNEEDRNIFYEFYYYQRKIKEISTIYNISESKTKTKLFRLRNKIKKELLKGGYSLNG